MSPTEQGSEGVQDKLYLFFGIIMGAVLGFFGSIYASWYYDTYKNQRWMPWVAFMSLAVFLGIIIFAYLKMKEWEKMLRTPSSGASLRARFLQNS